MQLSITNIDKNKYTTPNFKGMEHFDHIKRVGGMICAVCGEKTLCADTFIKTNTPNCKSLLYNMQNHALDFVKERIPIVWDLLVKYTKEHPTESLDKIMEDSAIYIELKQAVSEHISFIRANDDKNYKNPEQIDRSVGANFFDILDSARSYLEPASTVMKNLEELKPFLVGEQITTFELLKFYSEKYPEKTLSEIINTEEVYTYHAQRDKVNRTALYNKMHFHLDNINLIVEKERPDALPLLCTKKTGVVKMFGEVNDPEERVYITKMKYKNALEEIGCTHLLDRVYEEIDKIPKTFMSADTFFAYAHKHNFSDGKIITQIFSPNFATEEHLDAVAEGGIDKIENKIVMHKSCNQLRNRKPYARFLKYHPNMQEYVQYQVDLITEALLKEELPRFIDFYPLKMPIKLAEKTNNMINVDITRYCQEGMRLSYKTERELRDELDNIYNLRDRKIREKMNCKGPNPELDAELKFLHSEIFRVKESIKIEGKKRYRMSCYLDSKEE